MTGCDFENVANALQDGVDRRQAGTDEAIRRALSRERDPERVGRLVDLLHQISKVQLTNESGPTIYAAVKARRGDPVEALVVSGVLDNAHKRAALTIEEIFNTVCKSLLGKGKFSVEKTSASMAEMSDWLVGIYHGVYLPWTRKAHGSDYSIDLVFDLVIDGVPLSEAHQIRGMGIKKARRLVRNTLDLFDQMFVEYQTG